MKIREGFVSNSSSSSYIVKIHDSLEDFASRLIPDYSYSSINLESISKKIDKRIDELKVNREREKEKEEEECRVNIFKLYDEHISELEGLKKECCKILDDDEYRDVDRVKFALKYNNIKIEEKDKCIELNYFTPMHNSFRDGMNGLLKEIVLFFMFDTDIKIECERIDDNEEMVKEMMGE